MARIARDYHNSVQQKDLPDEYGRMMATEITLEKCDVHLPEAEFNEMDKDLSAEDLGSAWKLWNNGKAPGIDGIPYEFYKSLDILYRESKGSGRKMFDVLGLLTKLYEDMETNGII
jgi:hypothetical protein